jgi:hypothetical protein
MCETSRLHGSLCIKIVFFGGIRYIRNGYVYSRSFIHPFEILKSLKSLLI